MQKKLRILAMILTPRVEIDRCFTSFYCPKDAHTHTEAEPLRANKAGIEFARTRIVECTGGRARSQ